MYSAETRLVQLFVAGLSGNSAEYRLFLVQLARHLRAYLRKRIPHLREDSEDLVQEILVSVHKARHTFRQDEPLTAWVHAIARYRAMEFLRTRARREAVHEPLDDDHEAIFAEVDDEPGHARRDIETLVGAYGISSVSRFFTSSRWIFRWPNRRT